MLYAMIAKDAPGALQTRLDVRPAHLDHLQSLGKAVVYAGALLDDNDQPEGSIVVFEAEDLDTAKAMAAADPFVPAGVFSSYEVKRWRIAINTTGVEF
ncbi:MULTISPECIES: YciI family protein [unclassified Devosia]|uniref:YciI family protein n=1 Tax=unclassified Devosia TaxID=196773 RepID=UPI00145E8CBC|nr:MULTISPECIES: YciI family protein [unclassified Devosia]MBJ6988610.1 YciI family protein [Devosia sp. MC521]QMW62588.1 YciI family protein [Devosia sp. MC521]